MLSIMPWLRRGSRPQWPVVLGEAGINSSALWIQHCRLRRALSFQPLAPTHHGKLSSEAAPTKENEKQLWRTASFPQGQRTLGPGHEDRRLGPPAVLHHGSQPVRQPGRETTLDAAYPHLRLLQSLKGGFPRRLWPEAHTSQPVPGPHTPSDSTGRVVGSHSGPKTLRHDANLSPLG